jgi:GR25 family glycosyltransferase involved in LPS biosynthesis
VACCAEKLSKYNKKMSNTPEIYVINLDRSPQRWESIHANLNNLQLQHHRVSAVDANNISDKDILSCYNTRQNRGRYFAPLKKSEIACFLSHRLCWQKMVDENVQVAVILEDDVVFDENPIRVLEFLKKKLALKNQPAMVKLFSRRAVKGKMTRLTKQYHLIRPFQPPLGTQGQILNLHCARQLLQATAQFDMPIDVTLQRWWETQVKIEVLKPNLIREVSAQLGGSTVSGSASLMDQGKWVREIKRPLFRLRQLMQGVYKNIYGIICSKF